MVNEEKENNISEKRIILGFLKSVENVLEDGKKYITARLPSMVSTSVKYNTITQGFIQDGKEKYEVTLTLSLVFDKDEIIQTDQDTRNWQDHASYMARAQIEDEKKKADEYLKRREEKLRKMKSKD